MRLNKDNVINAICIFGIVVTICFMLIVTLKFLYGEVIDVAFIKDIFSIGTTLFAALIAISLFNDWKEQHNKQVTNTLALQAYDVFSAFEKNILEFASFLSDIEGLINSYEYDLKYDSLQKEGHLIYVQNVVNKKNEIDITFLSLLSKLKAYSVIKENYINFGERSSFYHDKFVSINEYELEVYSLRDNVNEWESHLIGYRDLAESLKKNEINQLLNDLRV
ncbi:hypothetical protein OHV62_07370 [Acinetobacter baumannii]|nr:hypothetical protein [Acinetobacter baumannii]